MKPVPGGPSPARPVAVGVLGLQGGVAEHLDALAALDRMERAAGSGGVEPRRVLTEVDLVGLDGLILPGGESTAVGLLLRDGGLLDAIRERASSGLALWGTCMGAVLLARDLENDDRRHLSLMDIAVRRNAFGSQLDSFVERGPVAGIAGGDFPMVFIRAPIIAAVGPGVEVLARARGQIVACRQGTLLATSFHPELTDDLRFHAYFAALARQSLEGRSSPAREAAGVQSSALPVASSEMRFA